MGTHTVAAPAIVVERWSLPQRAIRQAGLLFFVVGVLGLVNDVLPGSTAHEHPLSSLVDVANTLFGVLTWSLSAREVVRGKWSYVLTLVALSSVATSNVLGGLPAPTLGIWFVLIFVWVGMWFPRGVVLASSPLAVAAYVLPLLNGAPRTKFDLISVFLVVPGAVLAGEVVATTTSSLRRAHAEQQRLVAEIEARTEELRHQALHDALTGLPNRFLISDRIEQVLARSRRSGTQCSLLFLDLDGFKNVNDSMGHGVGDELLKAVARRLSASIREADTIGRMGGDEFVILIDGATLSIAPELVAERVVQVMREPFDIPVEGAVVPFSVTTSVGIATGDRPGASELIRDADIALYQAKDAGKNRFVPFDNEADSELRRRFELELDLRSALAEQQFFLVYQPIYDLADLSLSGVEALLRWEHRTWGELQPDEFIPLLESSGQIIEVGRWVLAQACTQMAHWRAHGIDMSISVNVSSRQLGREGFIQDVREALSASALPAEALTLEINETTLMRDRPTTAQRLTELKRLGVRISIDDFGTGYSSLSYLQQFPVDSLKIDRTFVEAISRSPESDALIHTLVQLGRDLGLRTVAEGVESPLQVEHLQAEHVNLAQGFMFARPLTSEQFSAQFLHEDHPVEGD
ncbi:MAG: EAL domain-containing protein [Acidobacteriota bacterium]|nr:EAL domain-containing protein [Acidobacteriota bacterium]